MGSSVKTAERLFAAYAGESVLVLDALEQDGYANYVDTFLRPVVAEGRERPADAADATLRINAAIYSVVEDLRSGSLRDEDYVEPAKIYQLSVDRLDEGTAGLKDRIARMQQDPLWPKELRPERAGGVWDRSLISYLAPETAAEILESDPLWQTMRAHAVESPDEARLLIAAALYRGEGALRPMAGAALPAIAEAAELDPLSSASLVPGWTDREVLQSLVRDEKIDGFVESPQGYFVYTMKKPAEIAAEAEQKLSAGNLDYLSPRAKDALRVMIGPADAPGRELAARIENEASDRSWRELGGAVIEISALSFASGGVGGIASAAMNGARASSTAVRLAKFAATSFTFTTLGSLGHEFTLERYAKDALALGVLQKAAKLGPLAAKLVPGDSFPAAISKFAVQHGAAVGSASTVLTTFAAAEAAVKNQKLDGRELGKIFVEQLKLVAAVHAVNTGITGKLSAKRHTDKLGEVVAALERGQGERVPKLIFELEVAGKELTRELESGTKNSPQLKILLERAQSPVERELLRRAAKTHGNFAEIEQYAAEIRGKPFDQILALSSSTGVQQHWTHSCVPAVLQTALARTNPVYAYRLNTDPAFAAREQRAWLEKNGGKASPRDYSTFKNHYPAEYFHQPEMSAELSRVERFAGRGIEPHRAISLEALEAALGVPYEVRVSESYAANAQGASALPKISDSARAIEMMTQAAKRGYPVPFSANTPLGVHEMMVVGAETKGRLLIFDPMSKTTSPVDPKLMELLYPPQTVHLPRL
jgi:hypothetical protein